MTNTEFNRILKARLQRIKDLLKSKGHEYARGDRLSNFKYSAATLRQTAAQACLGQMSKHITSIVDMVNDERVYDVSQWEEKIGDAINYLILLEAIVKEEL